MTAYEIYCCDKTGQYQLIGVLPERRQNQKRVTQESVMNWGRMLGNNISDVDHLYFIQVEM